MKLIIAKDGVKREINTPFDICCDVAELDKLIQAMMTARSKMLAQSATYGWMHIEIDTFLPSGPPIPWTHMIPPKETQS